MWFITFAIFSIFFYIRGYKVTALLIFFFFLTEGFNLVPDELVDLGTPLTKSSDYAFFILLAFLFVDFFSFRKFLKIDLFVVFLLVFFAFLFVCVIYNRYGLGVGMSEIIRTIRYLFFCMAYFVFRTLDKEQLQSLFKCLFIVTVFTSILYLLQIPLEQSILVETTYNKTRFFGMSFTRNYNQPSMLHFFVFMSIYASPFKGIVKKVVMGILILALFAAFHRSLMGFFLVSIIIGYFLSLPKINRVQISVGAAVLMLFVVIFGSSYFTKSRTYKDIKTIMTSKNILDADINISDLADATFTFRMAHLLERNEYLRENPMSQLFGAALITEDSKNVDKMFDFQIGLIEEFTREIIQVDTGDISYSVLLLRFGYLGTILYLAIFFYLMFYFYKKRDENIYARFSFLYMILIFGVSFFSSNLVIPMTFLLPMISYLIIKKQIEPQSGDI